MSLVTNIQNVMTRIATEIKAVRTLVNGNASDLTGLNTTAKGNLVSAINEVKGVADSALGGGVSINDAATNTTQTWSSSKINSEKPTWTTISGKPAVIAEGATQVAARTAIGAGTSNLAIGTTAGTAAEGNRAATATTIGMVELATTAEATTGTDTQRAVTPAGLKAVADTKAAATHDHDARYYTETEMDTLLSGKSPTGHQHLAADVTDIGSFVDGRIQTVVDSAPAALDTLNELAAAIGNDADFATTMTTALGNRVRVDASQTFTAPQMLQARQNIGAASATDIGDTTTNFVTTFEAALV